MGVDGVTIQHVSLPDQWPMSATKTRHSVRVSKPFHPELRASACLFPESSSIDPAIKHVEQISILSFPPRRRGTKFHSGIAENWVPVYTGKGRASTYLVAESIKPVVPANNHKGCAGPEPNPL
jgi:hypothetical protein